MVEQTGGTGLPHNVNAAPGQPVVVAEAQHQGAMQQPAKAEPQQAANATETSTKSPREQMRLGLGEWLAEHKKAVESTNAQAIATSEQTVAEFAMENAALLGAETSADAGQAGESPSENQQVAQGFNERVNAVREAEAAKDPARIQAAKSELGKYTVAHADVLAANEKPEASAIVGEQAAEAQDVQDAAKLAVEAAAEAGPEMAQMMLEIFKGKGHVAVERLVAEMATRLTQEGIKVENGVPTIVNPNKVAIGMDLQIASIKYSIAAIDAQEKQSGKLDSAMVKQRDELRAQLTDTMKQRNEGVLSVMVDGQKKIVKSEEVQKQPNRLEGLLKSIGVDPKDAEANPILALKTKVESLTNPKAQQDFLRKMAKAANLDPDTAKKFDNTVRKLNNKPRRKVGETLKLAGKLYLKLVAFLYILSMLLKQFTKEPA